MKIELEEPFRSKWKRAYLRVGNQGRQILDLVNTNQDRTTISYARYLKSVELGYEISSEFEVDHIDDNKTNDDINNLQVLTSLQNKLKNVNYKEITCSFCNNIFTITIGEYEKRASAGVNKMFCSHSCNGAYYSSLSNNLTKQISDKDKNDIKLLRQSGLTGKEISLKTGFNRNTVMKYW